MLVFFTGILTLGLEMTVGRLLMPRLGTSLIPWASLIAVVLFSYSLSYLLVQSLRQKKMNLSVSHALFAGSLFACIALLLKNSLLQALGSLDLLWTAILLHLLLAGVPSFFWAMVLPLTQMKENSRSAAILCWSTFGNLVGVFLVSLFMIPSIGPTATLWSLILLGLICAVLNHEKFKRKSVTVGIVTILALFGTKMIRVAQNSEVLEFLNLSANEKVLTLKHTPQQTFAVTEDVAGYHSFWISRFRQWAWCPDSHCGSNRIGLDHYLQNMVGLAKMKAPTPQETLVLGSGGGLLSWIIERESPEANHTNVEFDSWLLNEGSKGLPQASLTHTRSVASDARTFLESSSQQYDWIFIDVFVDADVPEHLITSEFAKLLKQHLRPNGVMIMNWLSLYDESGITRDWLATLETHFGKIQIERVNPINEILIAENHEGITPLFGRVLYDEKTDVSLRLWETQKAIRNLMD